MNIGKLILEDIQLLHNFNFSTSLIMENSSYTRVLLAEDNAFNQKVAVAMLKKLGFQPEVANNGLEVLDKISTTNYALIFMDCEMPLMNGYETTAKIRTHEKENAQHIPIVAMTAHNSPEDREHCLSAGMDDYISKPFKIDELQAVLARWKPK